MGKHRDLSFMITMQLPFKAISITNTFLIKDSLKHL